MTVSIGAVRSAGGAANYFAADNYYTAEQAEITSAWAGEGARSAGLAGKVEARTFEAVLDGKLPNGIQVGDRSARDHGRDFTFSMPKSASLLAYVSGDKRILAAHMSAVRQTMAWVEKNLAEGRIWDNGKGVAVRTGNLLYALFPHDTSRAADPQGHIHAVIANMTRIPAQYRQPDKVASRTGEVTRDHGWRAWHNGAVYKSSALMTSMANALFRDRLEKLGYTVALTGKHGAFEIVGINREALEGFSKRSADIRAKAEDLGITSPEGRREITRRTRDAKRDPGDREALAANWRGEALGYGYTGDALYAQALERTQGRGGNLERGVHAAGQAIRETASRLAEFLRRPTDPLIDQGLARLTRSPETVRAQYATASAIRILGEREAAFRTNDILKSALDLGEKGVTPERVEQRIAELIQSGLLVPEKSARHDKAVDFVTTRDAIEQERRILKAMDSGAGEGRPLLPADEAARRFQELAGDRTLNSQQLAAAVQIISSQDRIVLVQGRAGAGKSTMLQPVARAEALDAASRLLGAAGTSVTLITPATKGDATALAFQNKMVADLRADTGLEAMTVHAFLARNDRFLEGKASPEAFAVRKAELAGRYLILDEASMISGAQMDRLTAIANLMEVGRLAVIGDRKQLNPIDAGKSFSLMQARAIRDEMPMAQVNINMRQKTEVMRAVADLADAGNVRAAIALLGDRVIETGDRIGDAARAWLALTPAQREATTLLPSSREGRAQANAIIQQGLKDEGTLQGEGRNFTVRDGVNLTHEDMRYARNWRGAAFLEVGSDRNPLGLARGDYRIDHIAASGMVRLSDMNGRAHRIDPLRIAPAVKNSRLRLATERTIRIHEKERIRWTDSDKRPARGMLNAAIAAVEKVSAEGIAVRLSSGEVRILHNADPMLKRMDLAYAINTHMAQGITNETVFSVMGARESNLSNARAFLVNHTRQQFDVRLFTDDKERLVRQLEVNRGDKTSALEAIGELAVERILREPLPVDRQVRHDSDRNLVGEHRGSNAPDAHSLVDTLANRPASREALAEKSRMNAERFELVRPASGERGPPHEKAPVRDQPELDRSKGLEL